MDELCGRELDMEKEGVHVAFIKFSGAAETRKCSLKISPGFWWNKLSFQITGQMKLLCFFVFLSVKGPSALTGNEVVILFSFFSICVQTYIIVSTGFPLTDALRRVCGDNA